MEFVETIKIVDGRLLNLSLHALRLERTARHHFGTTPELKIEVPTEMRNSVVKCRVVYASEIIKVEFEPYTMRRPNTIVVVECGDIDYAFKSTDRSQFARLIAQHSHYDDVLIARDGYLTDTTYANIVLEDQAGQLYTPSTPLLKGTKREQLIDSGQIQTRSITIDQLKEYTHLYLVNAMIDIEDQVRVKTQNCSIF